MDVGDAVTYGDIVDVTEKKTDLKLYNNRTQSCKSNQTRPVRILQYGDRKQPLMSYGPGYRGSRRVPYLMTDVHILNRRREMRNTGIT